MSILNETVDKFASTFCPYYHTNYGVQHNHNSGKWNYKRQNNCSTLVRSHLEGKYWLAFPSTWYIPFGYIDSDDPLNFPLEHTLDMLHFADSERLIMSSPGYLKDGKTHMIFIPRYKNSIMTHKLYQNILGQPIKNTGAELFPRGRRLFRAPSGRDQHILDDNGNPLNLTPEEFMYYVDKIDPYETSEKITHQSSMFSELYPDTTDPTSIKTVTSAEAIIIEKHGLQRSGTRHDSCLILVIEYYKRNYLPEKISRLVKCWIRKKHHGFSKEINRGKWYFVDKEIDDLITWVEINYAGTYYPNAIHNYLTGIISLKDVRFIADIFRYDWINIKRTIALFQYCRPRSFFPWIYIPVNTWDKIASHDYYKSYQDILSEKGIIRKTRSNYLAGRYPKSFRIALPNALSLPITDDDRAVTDIGEILLRTFGTVREAVQATGISKSTAWDLFHRF